MEFDTLRQCPKISHEIYSCCPQKVPAQNRCWNELLTNYVTNAINELIAYPEADLPD